jgi:hypothetical protein
VSVSAAEIKQIVLSFPGGNEQMKQRGTAVHFYIGRKFLTWIRPEENSLVVRLSSLDERDSLIESDPSLFHITDHYRDYPAVLVRLNRASLKLVRAMLERRFREVASRKQLTEWEAMPPASTSSKSGTRSNKGTAHGKGSEGDEEQVRRNHHGTRAGAGRSRQ